MALERESAASPAQQAFWVQQLTGCQRSRLPRWPAAHRSPQPRRGQSRPIPVPADLSDRLHKLAQEAGVPLKSVLLAAHLRVMRTPYNEADVLTGLAAQGRLEAIDSERVKGLFLNTLPFRLQLHGGTWLELIRATFRAEQEVLPYQRLTQAHLASRLPATAAEVIRLDADWPAMARQPSVNPTVETTPDSLAYVMYTSGSTGQPKGVCVVHRGVVRLVKGTDYVSLSPAETLLQLAPITFDASAFEIWGALLNGASLVVMSPGAPALREIGETVRRHGVTTLWLTAGLFHLMVDERLADLVGVRQLLAGGDVLSPAHVRKARRALPGCRLLNGYGPTENTTFTTCYTITDPDQFDGSVPIGRPIANTAVYVLDPNLQPVPVGAPGELYVGGAGQARGYLNRPDLTAERFIPNPFGEGRLYKTGDLVRYLPTADGAPHLEFLGRLDDQVKMRGFRVELGEVEAALAQHPAVAQTAVTLREDLPGHKQLVAYVVARPGPMPTPDVLRAFLGQKLPAYMVPAGFVQLDSLPLTANGKVDRHSLPAPASAQPERTHTVIQPRKLVEQTLAAIWADVLGLPQVGVKDDFFDLGGDSLLALRLQAQTERHFQRELPPLPPSTKTRRWNSWRSRCMGKAAISSSCAADPVGSRSRYQRDLPHT